VILKPNYVSRHYFEYIFKTHCSSLKYFLPLSPSEKGFKRFYFFKTVLKRRKVRQLVQSYLKAFIFRNTSFLNDFKQRESQIKQIVLQVGFKKVQVQNLIIRESRMHLLSESFSIIFDVRVFSV